jgi:hypothetical protein
MIASSTIIPSTIIIEKRENALMVILKIFINSMEAQNATGSPKVVMIAERVPIKRKRLKRTSRRPVTPLP